MKKIIIFLIIFSYIVYPQDTNNINTNETNNSYQNIQQSNIIQGFNDYNNANANTNDTNGDNTNIVISFIRAIIGFILTLIGIYLVFIYLKNRTKKISGSNEIIRILATTAVAANRYISIIEIADEMYLISISDHNINLLEKIENKDIKDQIRMMYINSKENAVEDSFKNILNQTLSIFKQPKMKEKDALESTKEIRERLRNLNSDNSDNNEENKDNR